MKKENEYSMSLEELETATLSWSSDKRILKEGSTFVQALKLVSEVGELCDNLIKGRDVKDDIGDCMVLLTSIARMSNTTLAECWNHAYNDIKDRKGCLNKQGNFVKKEMSPNEYS